MTATLIARPHPLWLTLACLSALLAACGSTTDADEMRACRLALPALDNQGARIILDRTAPGPFRHSLRIDYRSVREGEPTRIRHVICRFSDARNARGRRELVGIATEFGPMADASFYLLRRFYLDTPDAERGDPAANR